jgi:electron transfer flavoprotein alpha subunit
VTESVTGPAAAAAPAAVIMVRRGRLPTGADEAVEAAGGAVVVVGSGTREGAAALGSGRHLRVWETGDGFAPGALAAGLAPALVDIPLVILPASADGRDLAPRLAAEMDRPLLAGAESVALSRGDDGRLQVEAAVARLDDRILVDVTVEGPAVATLIPHRRDASVPVAGPATIEPLHADGGSDDSPPMSVVPDPEVEAVLEPDLATLDLADARVVVAGGAGLVHGRDEIEARATFALLGRVANALGGAAGATRVATDAGWTSYDRQIGTTGVAVDPDLYVAFGISGAAQHVGGLGSPRHVVSVNVDGSCPMTAMADLGLVTDAHALLDELARRFGVEPEPEPEPEPVG